MSPSNYEKEVQIALIRLDEAWNRLSRQIAADIKEQPLTIPLGQAYLLRLLDKRGPISMSELAASLGVKLSGCTALVDRAVEAGWVERKRDPADRRVVRVEVSAGVGIEIPACCSRIIMNTAQYIYYCPLFNKSLLEQDASKPTLGFFLDSLGFLKLAAGDMPLFTEDFPYPCFSRAGLIFDGGFKVRA